MPDINTLWLKINYFGISHRSDIKKWWVMILLAVDVFIIIFIVTNLIVYLLNLTRGQQLIISIASSPLDYRTARTQRTPQPLITTSTAALAAGDGTYDVVAKVQNTNRSWAAERVSYVFSIGGQETESATDFIMPGAEKYLTALGARSTTAAASSAVSLTIQDVQWKRVDSAEKLPPVDFAIDEITYSPLVSPDGSSAYRVTAEVTNRGYDSFWQTRFIVLLGDRLVGINYVYFDQFKTRETMFLSAQWESVSGTVSNVAIVPDINVLNADNIIEE